MSLPALMVRFPAGAAIAIAPGGAPTMKSNEGDVAAMLVAVMSSASPVPPWAEPTPDVPVAAIDTLPAVPVPMLLVSTEAPESRTDGPEIVTLPPAPVGYPGVGTEPVAMLPPVIRTACVGPSVPLPVMLTLPALPEVWVTVVKLSAWIDETPLLVTLMSPALPVDWTGSDAFPLPNSELRVDSRLVAMATEPPLMLTSPAATAPLVPALITAPVTEIAPGAVSEMDAGTSAAVVVTPEESSWTPVAFGGEAIVVMDASDTVICEPASEISPACPA